VYHYNLPSVLEPGVGRGAPRKHTRVMRQMHAKGQSCISATFNVVDNIDTICPLKVIGRLIDWFCCWSKIKVHA
jgi:hypothetical protein